MLHVGKKIPRRVQKTDANVSRKRAWRVSDTWLNFKMHYDKLELPTGHRTTDFAEVGLLEIQSELELKTTTVLLKYVRAIVRIKGN